MHLKKTHHRAGSSEHVHIRDRVKSIWYPSVIMTTNDINLSLSCGSLVGKWEIITPLAEGQWKLFRQRDTLFCQRGALSRQRGAIDRRWRRPEGGIMNHKGGIMWPEGGIISN